MSERQRQLEAEARQAGADRAYTAAERSLKRERDDGSEAIAGPRYMPGVRSLLDPMAGHLAINVDEARRGDTYPLLLALPPAAWAALALNTVLADPQIAAGVPWTSTALEIMRRAQLEFEWRLLRKHFPENAKVTTRYGFGRGVQEAVRLSQADMMQAGLLEAREHFTTPEKLRHGVYLLSLLLVAPEEGAASWFAKLEWRERGRIKRRLALTEAGMQLIVDASMQENLLQPVRMPMVCAPADYKENGQCT